MTARGIASRLVARHGIDFARGYVAGRHAWYVDRLRHGIGAFTRTCVRVTLWAAVGAALGREA